MVPSCAPTVLLCSLLSPPPFLEELHKDNLQGWFTTLQNAFQWLHHRQAAISATLVGGSQPGWPGVELPLLCLWPSALHLDVCLGALHLGVCLWVHCPAFGRVSMASAEVGEVGARGLGDHRGSQCLWTPWVAVCLLMSPIKHKGQSGIPSGFLSWPHLAESPLGPFCVKR